jgi:hypothetical protein
VKEPVGIGNDSRGSQRHQRTDRRGLAFQGKLVEESPIHVGVGRWIGLQQVGAAFDRHRGGGTGNLKADLDRQRNIRSHVNILCEGPKSLSRDTQVIRVKRDIVEGELPGAVCRSRPDKAAHRIMNLDARWEPLHRKDRGRRRLQRPNCLPTGPRAECHTLPFQQSDITNKQNSE